MKIAGHTMGTPEYDLYGAARLFREIGLDAIEVIFQDGYGCAFNWASTDGDVLDFRKYLDRIGLEASCVVSYASDYNALSPEKRAAAVRDCRRAVEIASLLSAGYVRIYGGTYLAGDRGFEGKRAVLVETMRDLSAYAGDRGVALVLENHFNTMTTMPDITMSIVAEIDRENVGILYDQANITFMNGPDYEASIRVQKDKILYVHAKDLIFKESAGEFRARDVTHVSLEERTVLSKPVGQGIVPWHKIVPLLRANGYDGYLSLEYERRWLGDELPKAEIGMKAGTDYLKAWLLASDPDVDP